MPTAPCHRALPDAEATAQVLVRLIGLSQELGARRLSELRALAAPRKRRVYDKRALARGAPARPGVYLFHDRHGQVLYVGRSRDLRARLRSYFRSERQRPSVEAALLALDRIEWRVLGSELEAALEELRLIRELEPPANSRSRRRERGVYLRRRGDDFVVSKQPGPLGPIGSRRQAALAARALAAATDEELESLLDGGPLPRLRATARPPADSLRYEEAARLRDRIEALEQVVERLARLERLRELRACLVAPAAEPGWRNGFFVAGGTRPERAAAPARNGRAARARGRPRGLPPGRADEQRAADRRAGRGPAAARRLHPPPASRARRAAPRARPDRGASRRDGSVLDSANELPELRPRAAGNVPVLPVLRGARWRWLPTAPRREERKVVSVLFADLVGFTARAETLDPEDVRGLLAPYHAQLRAELERFGGTVEKFIGDAVVALFGAPVSHEDDPERAVRAALAIRDWVGEQGEELQVRVAVNTGEALVALDARPSEGEGMAAGDVVNTAARLQTGAPVNGILVGEQTYRATAAGDRVPRRRSRSPARARASRSRPGRR